ncbi:MAG: response regulator [Gammaproteobacteria bacterium]|nr:response regulator [Gammaproteobacteria bacterium]MCP5136180.1 response regulator [Gammaproteobacteria bacterium]
MRVLLVEDDALLGDGVRAGLTQHGYTVDWVRDGVAAELALRDEDFDLAVLDLGLPRQDGLAVLRKLRAAGKDTPVLILTARDTVADRVAGLDAGADDYLIKPFDLDELSARLRALTRRRAGRTSSVIRYQDLELDPAARSLTQSGQAVILTARELAIFEALMNNIGRALSKERLEEALYGWDEGVESNAIEVHIHHLRKKLGKERIKTVRGIGYLLPKNGGSF